MVTGFTNVLLLVSHVSQCLLEVFLPIYNINTPAARLNLHERNPNLTLYLKSSLLLQSGRFGPLKLLFFKKKTEGATLLNLGSIVQMMCLRQNFVHFVEISKYHD